MELAGRIDTMETSLKQDIRTILDILHQQQQHQQQHLQHQPEHSQKQPSDKQTFMMTSSYQPSESDFSFDLFGLDKRPQQRITSSATNVHRSISQPECTNTSQDKSLLR